MDKMPDKLHVFYDGRYYGGRPTPLKNPKGEISTTEYIKKPEPIEGLCSDIAVVKLCLDDREDEGYLWDEMSGNRGRRILESAKRYHELSGGEE